MKYTIYISLYICFYLLYIYLYLVFSGKRFLLSDELKQSSVLMKYVSSLILTYTLIITSQKYFLERLSFGFKHTFYFILYRISTTTKILTLNFHFKIQKIFKRHLAFGSLIASDTFFFTNIQISHLHKLLLIGLSNYIKLIL